MTCDCCILLTTAVIHTIFLLSSLVSHYLPLPSKIPKMMFARVVALSCLALGADAFFMGTPLRTTAGVRASRTVTSMKVPTDHPEIEVYISALMFVYV